MLTARSTGTDRVALAPTWYMSDASSNSVFSDPAKTPTDASIEAAAERAGALGLDVVLKPHVDVQDGTFRGEINPSDPSAWFASYDQMVLHYAELAQRIDANALVIGTELTTMTPYEGDWRALIDQIRSVYDGKLTFAANWVDGAESINFWDALDFIGIDAYMPLQTPSADPSVAELLAAWGPYKTRMEALQSKWHEPIVFTELGYQSRQGTAARQGQDAAPVSDSLSRPPTRQPSQPSTTSPGSRGSGGGTGPPRGSPSPVTGAPRASRPRTRSTTGRAPLSSAGRWRRQARSPRGARIRRPSGRLSATASSGESGSR